MLRADFQISIKVEDESSMLASEERGMIAISVAGEDILGNQYQSLPEWKDEETLTVRYDTLVISIHFITELVFHLSPTYEF